MEKNNNIEESERARKALLSLIEDQKETLAKLKESEELFRTLAESTSTAIFIYKNEKFVYVNSAGEKLTGYSSDELLRMNFWEVVHPDFKEIVKQRGLARQRGENVPNRYEFKLLKKDGSEVWIDFSAGKIIWAGENAAIGSAFDITERKLAEEKLRESEKLYRLIADNSSNVITVLDFDLRFTYVSPSIQKLLGYRPEELINNEAKKLFTEESFIKVQKIFQEELELEKQKDKSLFRSRTVIAEEFHKDGHKIWSEITASFLRDENGNAIGILASTNDITERKRLEDELVKSEEKYRLIAENTADTISVFDLNLNYTYISPSIKKLLGYTAEELMSIGITKIIKEEYLDYFQKLLAEELDKEKSSKSDPNRSRIVISEQIKKDGTIIWVEATVTFIRNENNEPIGILSVNRDITERVRLNEELKKSEEKLRLLVEGTSHYFFFTQDEKANITYVSPSVEFITGYKKDEWIGRKDWFVSDSPMNKIAKEKTYAHLRGERSNKPYYAEIESPVGQKILLEIFEQPIVKEGKIIGLQGIATDITEKKRAETIQKIQYNIANAVVTSKTLNELFLKVRDELDNLMNTKNFFIAFYDEKTEMLRSNIDKDEKDEIPVWSAKKSLTGYVIKKKKPILLSKEQIIKLSEDGVIELIGTLPEAWVGVPLMIESKVIGVIAVQDYHNKYAFNKNSLELLEIISKQLSIYIEQKQSQEKILKLSYAIEQSPVSIFITDIDGKIEYINPKFSDVTGYTFEEVMGKNPRLLKSGFQDIKFYKNLWETILEGKTWQGEFVNKKKSGELYYESALISPIKNEEGKITNFVAIKEDITEKKKLTDKIIQSEEQFRSIWENSIDAMRLIDENGIITDVNEAFCKLFELSKEELIGKTFDICYSENGEGIIQKFRERYLTNTIPKKLEAEIELHNHKKIWIDVTNSKVIIKDQTPKLLSIFRDISERKKMIEELIQAKEKAEEMNRIKSHFFATMSHELRTPFVGIMGFAELLNEELENPQHKEMANAILKSSKRLTTTLNQILDMTKLEFDKNEIHKTNFDAIQIIDDVYLQFEKAAKAKNVELRTNFKVESLYINTDERLFSEILINLVNNAVKYTEQGWIEIFAERKFINNRELLVLKVKDTGIGIPKDKQEIIWEEFRQASEGLTRRYEGTGLGLSIVKRFAELIQANVYLEESTPKGSTFVVEIPVESEKQIQKHETIVIDDSILVEENSTNIEKASKKKILSVEDDPMATEIVARALSKDYEVEAVTNSKDAINIVKEKTYDLILMDINLGRDELDGVELTQKIRQIHYYKKIPIVALTAYAREEDRDEFLSKGMDYYLSKPFMISDLKKLMKGILK